MSRLLRKRSSNFPKTNGKLSSLKKKVQQQTTLSHLCLYNDSTFVLSAFLRISLTYCTIRFSDDFTRSGTAIILNLVNLFLCKLSIRVSEQADSAKLNNISKTLNAQKS